MRPLDTAGVFAVITAHRMGRFHLVTTVAGDGGKPGVAHINQDPIAMVDELLRLAMLGAHTEGAADANPNQRVSSVLAAFKASLCL
ncbi:MAG: hypothetical protein ACXW3D_11565 [Caulobacteraceae bacterium]